MQPQIILLIVLAGSMLLLIGAVTFFSNQKALDGIKSKTVGDGQHGTARWATPKEIQKIYAHIPFRPAEWREGKNLPKAQGLVLGSAGAKNKVTALVDSDDIHCLMIGASGVGKTAFFLYPNLEYACASGMSYLALDTKGDLARNYGTIAKECYGYQVSVIDLRNPTAEVLSKSLGSRTVMSGSISKGKNETNQSLQMMERPLMTPDELKSIPKGEFVVMKTGTHPMRTRLRLFLDWGITFGEAYHTPERAQRKVYYADRRELEAAIVQRYHPEPEDIPPAPTRPPVASGMRRNAALRRDDPPDTDSRRSASRL